MMSRLDRSGWVSAPHAEDADLIIVNSCGFIESAKQESINAVLGWRRLYPEKKILLAGCLAQRYAKELGESLPEADGFFGTTNIGGIADAASALVAGGGSGSAAADGAEDAAAGGAALSGARPLLSLPGSAYVKISEGCNNRCTFCAIPLIRGSLRSRSISEILEECRGLLSRGVKELCVIGQDIGSFGKDFADTAEGGQAAALGLPELLEEISLLEGDFWVRLLYIHPDHFPLKILDLMERDPRFLPYFDIPFQHGSAKILAAMNRRGSAESYLALLETIRRRLPEAVIRSTFLLGFPGETDEDFGALLDFQEKAAVDWLGCFTFSREDGTAAYSMKNRVAKKTAARRKGIVEERQIPITEKNMDRFTGKTLNLLVEERIEGNSADADGGEDIWLGRLYCQAPEVDGAALVIGGGNNGGRLRPGALVPAGVIARRGFDLEVGV